MTNRLRMYRFRLDRREMALLGRRHRIPARTADEGYLVHAALAACFGDAAPSPFTIDPTSASSGDGVSVLAYGTTPLAELIERLQATADVQAANVMAVDDCREKALPERWTVGARYGFRVRVCPVKRRQEGQRIIERDALLVWPGADGQQDISTMDRRRACYRAWFEARTDAAAGADFADIDLASFRLARFVRRCGDRKREIPEARSAERRGASGRPDATLTGTLTITDSDAFTALLARGIGRHKAFGFGMLLLQAPG